MKKFTKICLIAIAVCAILGLGFLVGGLALGGTWQQVAYAFERGDFTIEGQGGHILSDDDYDDYDDDDDDYDDDYDDVDKVTTHHTNEHHTESSNASDTYTDIRKIEVDMNRGTIYFSTSDDEQIYTEREGTVGNKTTIKREGDELKIENDIKTASNNGAVTVYLPDNIQLEELDINVGAGVAYVETPIQVDKLDVEVDAGQFEGSESIKAVKSSWEVGAGQIVVDDISGDTMEFECGVGEMDITVDGVQDAYDYDLECGVGSIEIGDDDYSGIGAEKKLSSSTSDGREIKVSCSVGAVTIDFND